MSSGYPRIEINLPAIEENARKLVSFGKDRGFQIAGITKGVCGDIKIAQVMVDSGIEILGDARIQNIRRLREAGIKAKYMLIREPMLSEIEDVVRYADYSVNSEISTLREISRIAREHEKLHSVIVMVDVGDRREGLLPSQVDIFLEKIRELPGIEIAGFGTNMGCFGGVLPTYENQKKLVEIGERAQKILGYDVEIISTGGTVVLSLAEKGQLPEGINQMRIGEAILLGTSTTDNRVISWLRQDTFTIKAEVIELNEKPSLPEGPRGLDALGREKKFEDRGIRKRAIVALGAQDVEIDGLEPLSPGLEILGGSSDHIILDAQNAEISVGDVVSFSLKRPYQYTVMLRAMTSPYVEKFYIS